ncbi:MAG: hypothetical protein V4484_23185 [Pseudomonadota bacterium]
MHPELAQRQLMIVPRLVDAQLAQVLYQMLLLRHWRGEVKHDRQVPQADSHWGDATLDAMLMALTRRIEQASGCPLLPTYAYARLYFRGEGLPRHRDRDAAQVAVTIHLGSSAGPAWPIWFAPGIALTQQPGDAVVYLGDRIEHWREPFAGEHFGQLFLNYVYADGERAGLIHDGRHHAFPPQRSA